MNGVPTRRRLGKLSMSDRKSASMRSSSLAESEAACSALRLGSLPIFGSDHAELGYESAASFIDTYRDSERWQLCTFFDNLARLRVLKVLRDLDWRGYVKKQENIKNPSDFVRRCLEAYAAAKGLSGYPRSSYETRRRAAERDLYCLNLGLA